MSLVENRAHEYVAALADKLTKDIYALAQADFRLVIRGRSKVTGG
jgi:hypothetical protein